MGHDCNLRTAKYICHFNSISSYVRKLTKHFNLFITLITYKYVEKNTIKLLNRISKYICLCIYVHMYTNRNENIAMDVAVGKNVFNRCHK